MSQRPRIALTLGDPLGIGPEIICKALADVALMEAARILIIGEPHYLRLACAATGLRPHYEERAAPEFADTPGIYNPCEWVGDYPAPGAWTAESGRQSLEYVKFAACLCLAHTADALVTCAISKAAWKAAGGNWPGHTELLGELCGGEREVMMLAGGGLRVALATIHEPLARVPGLLSRGRIVDTAQILADDLRRRFGLARPRIAVLGLNPHAGEDGHIGREEIDHIAPAVRELCAQGINATGPLPADTAFHRMLQGEFNAILAMYHDQGLAPLKTLAFDSGVNITLGLRLIRTSVDHGTAFDIAGSGRASAESLRQALLTAADMCRPETAAGE